jgi:hypothetical protein
MTCPRFPHGRPDARASKHAMRSRSRAVPRVIRDAVEGLIRDDPEERFSRLQLGWPPRVVLEIRDARNERTSSRLGKHGLVYAAMCWTRALGHGRSGFVTRSEGRPHRRFFTVRKLAIRIMLD